MPDAAMTGADIQAWRLERNLSLSACARALGVATSTVLRWEAGEMAIRYPEAIEARMARYEAETVRP